VRRLTLTLWNTTANALPRIAVLLAGLYVAYRFGAEVFARYSLAITTVAVAGNLFGGTLTTVGSKFVPQYSQGRQDELGKGFFSLMVVSAVLAATSALTILFTAPALARLLAVEPPPTELLRWSSFVIAAVILHGGAAGLLAGSARFTRLAAGNAAGVAVFAIVIVPLADRLGSVGVLLALAGLYFVAFAAAIASVWPALTRDFRATGGRELLTRFRSTAAFLLPMFIAVGMVPPVLWICNGLLARDGNLLDVARINAAYGWFALMSFLPAMLAQVEFVRVSQLKARGDVAGLARVLRRFIVQNLVLMLPVAAAGVALAGPLMNLYRVDDADGRLCLRLMLCAALIASLGNPAGLFLTVVDRIWIASLFNIGWAVIAMMAALALRDRGSVGIAFAFLVAYALHFLVATAVAHRIVALRTVSRGASSTPHRR
jgi:O-antigen/teichoic acid export membrane protein